MVLSLVWLESLLWLKSLTQELLNASGVAKKKIIIIRVPIVAQQVKNLT